jgi:hypothetical protein
MPARTGRASLPSMPRPIIAAVDPRGDDASPAALGAVLARLMGAPLIVAGAYPFDRAVDDLYPESPARCGSTPSGRCAAPAGPWP